MIDDPWLGAILDEHLTACYSRAMSITGSPERAADAVETAVRAIAWMRDRWPPTRDLGPVLLLATIVAARAPDQVSDVPSEPLVDEGGATVRVEAAAG